MKGGNLMDKETLKMISELLDNKLGALENKVDKEAKLLEALTSKVETIAKVEETHIEQQGKWTNGF